MMDPFGCDRAAKLISIVHTTREECQIRYEREWAFEEKWVTGNGTAVNVVSLFVFAVHGGSVGKPSELRGVSTPHTTC